MRLWGGKVRAGGGEGVSGQAEEPAVGGCGQGAGLPWMYQMEGSAPQCIWQHREARAMGAGGPGGRVASKGPTFCYS